MTPHMWKLVWRNHASVNSIRRPRNTRGVTLRGGRGRQFCPPQAIGWSLFPLRRVRCSSSTVLEEGPTLQSPANRGHQR